MQGPRLPKGALLPSAEIQLRLADRPDFEIPPADPALSAKLRALLGGDAPRYGVVLLDLSDPAHPRYAEHNPDVAQNPGSVGKLMVALAWFQALADRYPEDLEARRRVLRETPVVADAFIQSDHHTVPFWKPGDTRVVQRRIAAGRPRQSLDLPRLDGLEQLERRRQHGAEAPAPAARPRRALPGLGGRGRRPSWPRRPRPSSASSSRMRSRRRCTRNGLDLEHLRQGSFFSHVRQAARPGHLEHGHAARAAALPGEARAGQAGGRVLEPRDQEAALPHRPQDPLRLLAGARRRGRLLQVGLALQLPAGAGLRLREVPRATCATT